MPINSKTKGKVGELEFAELLRFHGYEARRGQQYDGSAGSPDVVVKGLEDFWFEVKRVEAGNLYKWMAQARRDAMEGGKVPVVMHRRNREDWVAILPAGLFLELLARAGYDPF